MTAQSPIPVDIKLHRKQRMLELRYAQGEVIELSCEYLRVYSPSAEVRGHGPGQEVLQTGKVEVNVDQIVPTGNYALQLIFSDGHDTGIYSWAYLYELGQQHANYWQDYLDRLSQAGKSRDPEVQVIRIGN